jgi:hypothetical protein
MQDDGPSATEQPIQFFKLDGAASTKSQERPHRATSERNRGPAPFDRQKPNRRRRAGRLNRAFSAGAVSSRAPPPFRRGLCQQKAPRWAASGASCQRSIPLEPANGRGSELEPIPPAAPAIDLGQGLAVRRRNDVGAGCCYLVAAERAAPVLYLISAPGPLRSAWHTHVCETWMH